jgi:hypothetical protein
VEINGGYGHLSVSALFVLIAFVYFKAIDVSGFEYTERALSDVGCCCC